MTYLNPCRAFFYVHLSGITKTKAKSRVVWDDVVKNWVPRFGFKKVKAEEEKNWMMHYKVGSSWYSSFASGEVFIFDQSFQGATIKVPLLESCKSPLNFRPILA